MSDTRASSIGGVRSLRARFENPDLASSPEPRGRSPATSNASESSRTTSKVRASFVSVEPSEGRRKGSDAAMDLPKAPVVSNPSQADSPAVTEKQSMDMTRENIPEDVPVAEQQKELSDEKSLPQDEPATSKDGLKAVSSPSQKAKTDSTPELKSVKAEDQPLQSVESNKKASAHDETLEKGGNPINTAVPNDASEAPTNPTAVALDDSKKSVSPPKDRSSATAPPKQEKLNIGPRTESLSATTNTTAEPNSENKSSDKKLLEQNGQNTESRPLEESRKTTTEELKSSQSPMKAKDSSTPRSKTFQELTSVFKTHESKSDTPKVSSEKTTKAASGASLDSSAIATVKDNDKISTKTSKSPLQSPISPKTSSGPTAVKSNNLKSSEASSKSAKPSDISKPSRSSISTSTSSIKSPTNSKPANKNSTAAGKGTVSSTGFVKPRPRSPTRPVRLPSHLTAPTASSAAKHDPSSTDAKPNRRHSTIVRDRPIAPKTSTTSLKSSRTSLPSQPTKPHEPPKSAPPKSSEGGFLARMMRPTASSASKSHEKVEVKSPPRRTLSTKSRPTEGPRAKARKAKESLEKVKDAVTSNGHAGGPSHAPQEPVDTPTAPSEAIPSKTEEASAVDAQGPGAETAKA